MKTVYSFLIFVAMTCWADQGQLELLITPEEINSRLNVIAQQLNIEYLDKELTVVIVMKGGVCITADLIRKLDNPIKLDYIKASSYGENGTIGGTLKIDGIERLNIAAKHVLVVDDIFDTGKTMEGVVKALLEKNPLSLKSLVLLMKDVPHKTSYRPDYVLFEIKNRFVVGYGLDYKEYYRGLPGIYAFVDDIPPVIDSK